jgi:hypothetical protein
METTSATTSHMKVNPNRKFQDTATTARVAKKPAAPVRPTALDQADFTASAKLALKLAATPEVRADQVARAKALIADPNYPNAKTVRAIARKLADNIKPASGSDSEA